MAGIDELQTRGPGPGRQWYHRRQWVALAVLLGALVLLTVDVVAGGPLSGLDRAVRDGAAAGTRSAAWLGGPARLIVWVAGPDRDIAVLAVVAVMLTMRRRSLVPVAQAAAAIALLLATVIPAKWLIGRPDPSGQFAGALGFFPSGHTTSVCVCYGAILFLLFPASDARGWRVRLGVVAALGVVVGAALVWCQYHWLTDVIAGWLLAAIMVPLAGRAGDLAAARLERWRAGDHPG